MGQSIVLPPRPDTWRELGDHLARFRLARSMSLATAAAQAGTSRSSLQRYETGARLKTTLAAKLDELYLTKGWIQASVAALQITEWVWRRPNSPQSLWTHRWDATHAGQVWIALAPERAATARTHTVQLLWGRWQRQLRVSLPSEGVVLTTGKDEDPGPAPHLELQIEPKAVALFGVDDPPATAARVIDIRVGWTAR